MRNARSQPRAGGIKLTRRERMKHRAERRLQWAESRDRKAAAADGRFHSLADGIPFGQPILVGHHSEGRHRRDIARMDSALHAAADSSKMAEHHRSKAAGAQAQLDRSIYSDDPDAPERLAERIAELEAQRGRLRAYNASCRRGTPDLSLLDDKQRGDLMTVARVCSYQLGKHGEMPAYASTNLGGNIRRLRLRLAEIGPRTGAPE